MKPTSLTLIFPATPLARPPWFFGFDSAGCWFDIAIVTPQSPRARAAALRIMTVFVALAPLAAPEGTSAPALEPRYGLVIHGGAWDVRRGDLTPERHAAYTAALAAALDAGDSVLDSGGTALDAVVAVIQRMEDSPLFNAGMGAVLNADGRCELDASIMNGLDLSAGAVAGVHRIRNPITLARAVMERSGHVMLSGDGAEQFALSIGQELVDPSYFITDEQRHELQKAKEREAGEEASSASPDWPTPATSRARYKWGTVGCVALDKHGNLAAGTSTGGMMNKRYGRIGDSPVIGAGTYADNATCAVSSTGWGEFFIRASAAHDIASRIRYGGVSLAQSARETIDTIGGMGGTGGVIAIDRTGAIATPYNTASMYRAWQLSGGEPHVAIFAD